MRCAPARQPSRRSSLRNGRCGSSRSPSERVGVGPCGSGVRPMLVSPCPTSGIPGALGCAPQRPSVGAAPAEASSPWPRPWYHEGWHCGAIGPNWGPAAQGATQLGIPSPGTFQSLPWRPSDRPSWRARRSGRRPRSTSCLWKQSSRWWVKFSHWASFARGRPNTCLFQRSQQPLHP